MTEVSEEVIARLNELKKYTFFELLELTGRVFIIVDYQEDVVIGKRGFLPEEKERGLVLVFNKRMNFKWDKDTLTATLIFGSTPEKCYIPVKAIAGVFSPDLKVQLSVPMLRLSKKSEDTQISSRNDKEKIINISDLRKKK